MDVKKFLKVCLGKWRWIYFAFCLWACALAIAELFRPDPFVGLEGFMVIEGELAAIIAPRRRGYILVKVKHEEGGVVSIVGFNNKLLGLKSNIGEHVKIYYQEDYSYYLTRPSGYALRQLEMSGNKVVSYEEMRSNLKLAESKNVRDYWVAIVIILALGSSFAYVKYCGKKLRE